MCLFVIELIGKKVGISVQEWMMEEGEDDVYDFIVWQMLFVSCFFLHESSCNFLHFISHFHSLLVTVLNGRQKVSNAFLFSQRVL